MCCVLIEAILMSSHKIPLLIQKRNSPRMIPNTIMYAAVGFFVRDSKTSSK